MTQNVAPAALSLRQVLSQLIRESIAQATGLPEAECNPILAQAKNPKFGDYQSNAMMALAKKLGQNPRQLASQVEKTLLGHPDFPALISKVEIAGPGFLNLHLTADALIERLTNPALCQPRQLPDSDRMTVVVDYSSPNVAKEMHVGHIRSTILGDAIARVLEFLGHHVIRQNHLGDWGTQFGMLLAFYRLHPERLDNLKLSDVENNYRQANELFKSDSNFEVAAKEAVVGLQNGDPEALALWNKIIAASKTHLHHNYARMRVSLKPDHDCGESFYNPFLADTVKELVDNFSAETGPVQVRRDEGAICVYLNDEQGQPKFRNKDDEAMPFLIQKSDGASLYATTDLAAVRYRARDLDTDWSIYVTDNRQALHFEMMFAVAQATGLNKRDGKPPTRLQHVTFGSILGEDRRPLKTRDGGTVKLSTLLDEAVEQASQVTPENAEQAGLTIQEIAERIGIGAIKYADLGQNRQTDYLFSWKKLLARDGNSSVYSLYAFARANTVLRDSGQTTWDGKLLLGEPAERTLALELCRLAEVVEGLTQEWRMNMLTDQLFGIASAFNKFYDTPSCRILKGDVPSELRQSRLHLCKLTSDVLQAGLSLLGIETVSRL